MAGSTLRLNDALLPPPPGGMAPGAALALLAHAALLAALALGVQWRASAPEVISADLWAAVPQQAAPPVVTPPEPQPQAVQTPPPPPPAVLPKQAAPEPDAQIAVERARKEREKERERERALELAREKAQQARLDREKRERQEKEQRDKQAREQKLADARTAAELEQRRAENLRRMLGQAGSGPATSTGNAAADAAPSKGYAGRLAAAIKPNIVFTDTLPGNPAAEVEVRATPTGTILARRITKSSGSKEWDDAVLRAIDRTGGLPRDVDGRVPATIVIAFRPQEQR